MNATYFHISKTTKSELINLLGDVNDMLKNSDSCKCANMARKAKLLKNKLEKMSIAVPDMPKGERPQVGKETSGDNHYSFL